MTVSTVGFEPRVRGATRKKDSVFAGTGFGWIRLTMGGKVRLTLWVKPGCSPQYTQMVPKWPLSANRPELIFAQALEPRVWGR